MSHFASFFSDLLAQMQDVICFLNQRLIDLMSKACYT